MATQQTKTIFLIRHGETTGDLEDRYGGDYDDHLTEKGIEQSQKLAKNISQLQIQKIFISPLIRAQETAKIVTDTCDIPFETLAFIKERNHYGVLSGLTKKEAKQQHPAQIQELTKGLHSKVTNAETYDAFVTRLKSPFVHTVKNAPEETIAFIAHGGVIRAIIRELCEKELIHLGDCSVLQITFEGGKFTYD
jgi:broad specificity phosphatase PhoE